MKFTWISLGSANLSDLPDNKYIGTNTFLRLSGYFPEPYLLKSPSLTIYYQCLRFIIEVVPG